MKLGHWSDRKSFAVVDYVGNANLLQEAERAGVSKFVYVSLHSADRPHCVVRTTGFFGFLREIQAMAERGTGVVTGNGRQRTNPAHEADVANTCVNALTSNQAEIPIGGPDVFTREEIVGLAFQSLKKSRLSRTYQRLCCG